MEYSISVPKDAGPKKILDTTDEVRAHLSAARSPHGDRERYAHLVDVTYLVEGQMLTIIGSIEIPR